MLWVHPFWQAAAIVLGWYVFHIGWARFAAVSLGRRTTFLWKRHVFLGKAVIYFWIYGAFVGGAAAWVKWRTFGLTGIHFWVGLLIVLMGLFGYWSGLRMDTHKKKRKILPLVHGANNLLLLLFSLLSVFTGTSVVLRLVL